MILSTIASMLAPVAGKLITAYLEPKILPVMEATVNIEKKYKNLKNDLKHGKLLDIISATPEIRKFVNKCGWNMDELDIIVKFCVLMTKKPPTEKENRDKWNDDDLKTLFDFLCVIGKKWVKMRGKRK